MMWLKSFNQDTKNNKSYVIFIHFGDSGKAQYSRINKGANNPSRLKNKETK